MDIDWQRPIDDQSIVTQKYLLITLIAIDLFCFSVSVQQSMKIDEKNRVSSISNQFPILIDWYRFWSIGEFIDCVHRAWHECNEIIIWLLYIYEIIVICDILSNKRIMYQLKVDLDKLNQIDQSEIDPGQMQAKFEQLIFF